MNFHRHFIAKGEPDKRPNQVLTKVRYLGSDIRVFLLLLFSPILPIIL